LKPTTIFCVITASQTIGYLEGAQIVMARNRPTVNKLSEMEQDILDTPRKRPHLTRNVTPQIVLHISC